MILTCPITPENGDEFDTQYAAHVYEWKRSELVTELRKNNFEIIAEYGLLLGKKQLKILMHEKNLGVIYDRLEQTIPSEWLIPVLSPLFPNDSKEIAMVCRCIK